MMLPEAIECFRAAWISAMQHPTKLSRFKLALWRAIRPPMPPSRFAYPVPRTYEFFLTRRAFHANIHIRLIVTRSSGRRESILCITSHSLRSGYPELHRDRILPKDVYYCYIIPRRLES